MANIIEKVENSSLSRRKFLAVSAAATAAAGLGMTGCQSKVEEVDEGKAAEVDLENGKWIPYDCIAYGCANRCYNRAYVVDGVMLRHGTDNTHEDSEDYPQNRCCPKGRSLRFYLTSADRLKYPMKRKSWQPGGGENSHGELRGKDEWERISWDEAIDYIVNELSRIKEEHGNRAFLGLGLQDPHFGNAAWMGSSVMNLFGGCLTSWGQESAGGAFLTSVMMRGNWTSGSIDASDRMTLRHTKLLVLWGHNPGWSVSGSNLYDFIVTKRKSGCKVILVDPWFNPSAQALVDEWIPCRPGTDGAMLEAIAYEIIQNNWQDQDFLDRCCVGFDADHMPADAKTDENFKDYILGKYDGQPKTPEWASSICGVSADVIRNLAEQMATTKPMALKASQAPARTYYGNRFSQLLYTVGWMTGSIGIPGAETVIASGSAKSHFGAAPTGMVNYGKPGYQFYPNAICTEARSSGIINAGKYDPELEYGLCHAETFKAIVEGEYTPAGSGGEKRPVDIKAIYRDNPHCPASQFSGGSYVEEAYRKVDFVCVHDSVFSMDAKLADIVLPITSTLEADLCTSWLGSKHEYMIVGSKVIEPYFESKSDQEIYYMIADRLGYSEEEVPRMSMMQAEYNVLATSTVVMEDGVNYEPLVSITQEDIDALGVEGTPQEGRMPIMELIERGTYQLPRKDGDNYMYTYGVGFREDPEGHPMNTASGKLEIYCQRLKDYFDTIGYSDADALPKYKPSVEGYEEAKSNGEYPLQMITVHHMRHCNSMYTYERQLNEIFANDLLMNVLDAENLGLKKGDFVLVSSKNGKIARRLNPVPNVMPGVIILGEGNARNIDEETGVDMGGNGNTLTTGHVLGDGYQAYNSCLVKVEKWTGADLTPDYLRDCVAPISE